jgi:hypothetical protein
MRGTGGRGTSTEREQRPGSPPSSSELGGAISSAEVGRPRREAEHGEEREQVARVKHLRWR